MEFDSPDVEKDFPGLYASDSGSGRNKDDDDFSDGDHDKTRKKELLIGRRKEKKDRGYATLDGESSLEEDVTETNNLSTTSTTTTTTNKSTKISKAFKFPTKSSKDKREKSRDKDKNDVKDKDLNASVDNGKENKKVKDKKEKEKKDKKDKKSKQSSVSEDVLLELGDAQPIFGVSLGLAVERSRCHDQINLPLVIRDCIDYLQEFGLNSDQIYKVDAPKTKLMQLKRNCNNREPIGIKQLDVPTACGLLKLFFKELPEPILTTDLSMRFEEAASMPQVTQQQNELFDLTNQLPSYNKTLLAWTLRHFDAVIQNEKFNKINAQNLAVLLSPILQMSHRLFICMLCHCSSLFEDTVLDKYIPPITSTSPNLPETSEEIINELRKQDSLLNQIHAEMNAGYVTKKREEQLWEVQRIITQLKRKLRTFEKKTDSIQQKSVENDTIDTEGIQTSSTSLPTSTHGFKLKSSNSDEESSVKGGQIVESSTTETKPTKVSIQRSPPSSEMLTSITSADGGVSDDKMKQVEQITSDTVTTGVETTATTTTTAIDVSDGNNSPNLQKTTTITTGNTSQLSPKELIYKHKSGFLLVPESHTDFQQLLRLQIENIELLYWKQQLQNRITAERAEYAQLTELSKLTDQSQKKNHEDQSNLDDLEYEHVVGHYLKENSLLEQKNQSLISKIIEENVELIQMKVNLAVKNFKL